jgi:signal transduction histidine kinase
MWLAEVAAMAAAARRRQGTPPKLLLARMNATSPYRFPATFPGMGWFGLPVARLYLAEGLWAVLMLLGLLLYARTMCLKAWSVIAELREVNRGKEQFVAVASHEMRTPLTAILGYVATLRRRPIDDQAARDRFLEIVERQAQRLLGLVETTLTASKLERGRVAARFDWASVEEVCQEAGLLLTYLAAVPDPRAARGRRHPLVAILGPAAAAVLAGARSIAAIAEWAAEAPQPVRAALGARRDAPATSPSRPRPPSAVPFPAWAQTRWPVPSAPG